MGFLVDTNVFSEHLKRSPQPEVLAWIRENESELYLSTITVGEIRLGIELLDEGKRKQQYEKWLQGLTRIMQGRILSYNRASAHVWGQMQASLEKSGGRLPDLDSQIAAIALRHGLTVATRNESDFLRTGVTVVNPFEASN
jgi:predicted nucleic acid-binding protein